MAKKEKNTKEEVTEMIVNAEDVNNGKLIANEDIKLSTISDSISLSTVSLFDLLNLEKAASLICKRYENSVKMYDGSIRQSGFEYERFKKYVDIHQSALDEIEKRIVKYK